MDERHIMFGTLDTAEEGMNIGDSLSEQLGCFSVAATAITTVIATIISIVSISHWVFNFF